MPDLIDTPYPPADDLWALQSLKMPQALKDRAKVIARRKMLSVAAWTRLLIERECDREDAAAKNSREIWADKEAVRKLKSLKDSDAA